MDPFCLLKDAQGYVPSQWDLLADRADREYWLDHFEGFFDVVIALASRQQGRGARKRVEAAGDEFKAAISQLRKAPETFGDGRGTAIELDRLVEGVFHSHGLDDPFAQIKERANAEAAEQYPQTVQNLHQMVDEDRWGHLVKRVFAGNLFDCAADATRLLTQGDFDFQSALANTKDRPWLVDDYDEWMGEVFSGEIPRWTKAVVFVDNAGADFVLGVMPFVRQLALHGTMIVLGANQRTVLNDITVEETIKVVEQLAASDRDLAALIGAEMFEVVSTGSNIATIDLGNVSQELNQVAQDADLVVLEGMGRAIESNFDAAFKVDSLRIAVLKDARVAARIGGQLYDCVCKYARADAES